MRDVLGRLAQDRGLVELARGHQAAELLDDVERLVGVAVRGGGLRVLGLLDDTPQRGDRVAEGNDLLVDVDAVALLDHVVRVLAGLVLCAAGGGLRGGGAGGGGGGGGGFALEVVAGG